MSNVILTVWVIDSNLKFKKKRTQNTIVIYSRYSGQKTEIHVKSFINKWNKLCATRRSLSNASRGWSKLIALYAKNKHCDQYIDCGSLVLLNHELNHTPDR